MKLNHLLEAEVRSVLSEMGKQRDEMITFNCPSKKLESLYGSPKRVVIGFNCTGNPDLTSLEYCSVPTDTDGYTLNCHDCGLTSLKHAPRVVANLYCYNNPLTSLEGAPSIINSDLRCSGMCLTSLKGIHHHIKKINGYAMFYHSMHSPYNYKITSHMLGLMKIEGLQGIMFHNEDVQTIFNKHLRKNVNGCNLEACADELCDKGFDDYAQL